MYQDTSPPQLAKYIDLLRRCPPAERLCKAASLTEAVRYMAVLGIRHRHPGASELEVRARLAEIIYGREIAHRISATLCGEPAPATDKPWILTVALQCAEAFDQAQVGYFLGGSLASSLQGEPRSTHDIDFVVDLQPSQVEVLTQALGADFDVDVESLSEAISKQGSWSTFHVPSILKVDLFMLGSGPFDQSEFSRRRRMVVPPEGRSLYIKSPEDSVLRKLLWFKQGGEASSTQWRDITQVLRISRELLDTPYMDSWAAQLGVTSLLCRARSEASQV